MNNTQFFCQKCRKELSEEEKPCSSCGCGKRDIKVELSDTIKVRDSLRIRQKRKGFKKFMVELLQGWFPSKDKNKFPEGIQQTRIIDRENDRYREKVVNEATGEVVVDKNKKLSEKNNHG